jgi:hypothetical protein
LIADSAAHWQHLRRAMGVVLQNSQILDSVWDEHQAIADAVAEAPGRGGPGPDPPAQPARART